MTDKHESCRPTGAWASMDGLPNSLFERLQPQDRDMLLQFVQALARWAAEEDHAAALSDPPRLAGRLADGAKSGRIAPPTSV